MINRYKKFLELVDNKLANMFERQKPFIKCKKGCAYCCKKGKYPMSELEFVNIMFHYENLNPDIKTVVKNQILKLLESPMPNSYECPFLVNDTCSVYPARALICRAFGLMSFYEDKKMIPFCVDLGLNYADVYDDSEQRVVKAAEDGTEPVAFNIDRRTLRSKEIENDFRIFFGEDKNLYEFLKEEFVK